MTELSVFILSIPEIADEISTYLDKALDFRSIAMTNKKLYQVWKRFLPKLFRLWKLAQSCHAPIYMPIVDFNNLETRSRLSISDQVTFANKVIGFVNAPNFIFKVCEVINYLPTPNIDIIVGDRISYKGRKVRVIKISHDTGSIVTKIIGIKHQSKADAVDQCIAVYKYFTKQ
jgi:hypothetical protein